MMQLPLSLDPPALFSLLLLKGSILAVLGLTIVAVMRRSSAARRSAARTATAGGLLILPLLQLGLPPLAFEVPEVTSISRRTLSAPPIHAGPASPQISSEAASESRRLEIRQLEISDVVPWLVVAWASGAIILLGATGLSLARARWLVQRSAHLPAHHRAVELAITIARQLGLGRAPNVAVSAEVGVPSAVSTGHGFVVLPCACLEWTDAQLRPVLVHELAHLARRDAAARLLWEAARAIYWVNPLVWMAERFARTEQERAADDVVLGAGVDGIAYAEQLLHLARTSVLNRSTFALGIVAPGLSPLRRRVRAILDATADRRPSGRRTTVGVAAGVTCAAGFIAALTADARDIVPAHAPSVAVTTQQARRHTDDSVSWVPTATSTTRDSLTFRLLFASLPSDRRAAGRTARGFGDHSVADELLRALDDSAARCSSMRWRAVRALREVRDRRALPQLVERLVQDSSRAVRAMAATAIGAVGSEDGARLLRETMAGANASAFARADRAIESLGTTPAYYRLRRALREARAGE